MTYNIIITGLLIAAFFLCIGAYCLGVKHGRIVRGDGLPNANPVKVVQAVKQEAQAKKQLDLFSNGISNILNFGETFDKPEVKG